MIIGQFIHRVEECQYLAIILKKSYHRLVQTCQLFIRLVSAGVMRAAAVKHISTTVAALVLGYAVAIRKAVHLYYQRSLRIIL